MIDLTSALLEAETRIEMEAFLAALLSQAELTKFRQRVNLFRRLMDEEPHRTIATELGVGIATVTRAAAAMRTHNEIIQTILRRAGLRGE